MKATLKGRYEGDKATAAATLAVPAAGDLRLKASATEAAFSNGPSIRGLTLTLEKPGAFLIDLKPHNQDVRFQFMNSALVLDKRVSLTYTHSTSLAPAPAALPHRARLHRYLRSGQQGQLLPRARLRWVPRQVHLRARHRPPHHHRTPLRHQQERLGVRSHQEVPGRGRCQGHLPRLHQAARPRVEQGLHGWRLLQGCNVI
uniref:Uncharacterized protein n=1 Tax=Arundo donax TaxID=35708 RepID=A0A0A9EWV2_ARUDO